MKYSEDMLSALVNTTEMIEFVRGYLDAQPKATGGFTKTEKRKISVVQSMGYKMGIYKLWRQKDCFASCEAVLLK